MQIPNVGRPVGLLLAGVLAVGAVVVFAASRLIMPSGLPVRVMAHPIPPVTMSQPLAPDLVAVPSPNPIYRQPDRVRAYIDTLVALRADHVAEKDALRLAAELTRKDAIDLAPIASATNLQAAFVAALVFPFAALLAWALRPLASRPRPPEPRQAWLSADVLDAQREVR